MARRIYYQGDVNIEHGGFFYSLQDWPHPSAVRCIPCSDGGGPDNCFWVETLRVMIRDGARLQPVLRSVSLDLSAIPEAQRKHALIEAHISYGSYDIMSSETIRIGPPDPFYGGREVIKPDKVLRADTSLRRYVRDIARQEC